MVSIAWGALALLFGWLEATLDDWSPAWADKWKKDKHFYYTIIRTIAALLLSTFLIGQPLKEIAITWVGWILTFPFIHDGMYMTRRNTLSDTTIYPHGWLGKSKTTTAKMSFSPVIRIVMFTLGCAALLI